MYLLGITQTKSTFDNGVFTDPHISDFSPLQSHSSNNKTDKLEHFTCSPAFQVSSTISRKKKIRAGHGNEIGPMSLTCLTFGVFTPATQVHLIAYVIQLIYIIPLYVPIFITCLIWSC